MSRHFNGTSDGLLLASPPAILNAFSVSAWIAPQSQDGPQKIFQQGDSQQSPFGEWFLMLQPFGIQLGVLDNTGTRAAEQLGPYRSDGGWWHIAGTWDGSMLRLYVDGLQVHAVSAPNPILGSDNPAATIGYSNEFGFWFDGGLAEVGLWDTALSAPQIAALATLGTRASSIGSPKHYYRLLGDSSPEPDSAGTIAATLIGAPAKTAHPWSDSPDPPDPPDDNVNLSPLFIALDGLGISDAEVLRFYRLLAVLRPFALDNQLYDIDIVNLYHAATALGSGD